MLKNHFKKTIALVFISVFSLYLLAFRPHDRYFEIAKNLDIFASLFKELNAFYVDEINPTQLINTGMEAMLESLDPYTNYIAEEDIEDFRIMATGQYGGIGAAVGKIGGKQKVMMCYEGYPAAKAGIIIGDEITAIDGVDISDKEEFEINALLKGQLNTPVVITVNRYGQDKPLSFELKRARIKISNVPYFGMVNSEVGYIRLSDFTSDAGQEVKNALKELKSKGAGKIILDLRNNPGGLLNESVEVSNVFIPKGKEVVSTKGKMEDWNQTYKTSKNPTDQEIPLVILTSSMSASASEIVAGVVQDYDRGVLIGQRTFGKGLVQATKPLPYNSQVKLTTAKYYTPSGRCIQAIDYSLRNEDGSVGRIPDSLKVEFKTQGGRKVYDGGGVDPDIVIERKNMAPITLSLIQKGHIFDFATEYYFKNVDKVPDPKDFLISDAEYSSFVKWLEGKDYDYTTQVETNLEKLTELAKSERFYAEIKPQLDDLRDKIFHKKENDLRIFKDDIMERISKEIIGRYHKREGMIETSFDRDEEVKAAIALFNDMERYNEIIKKVN